MEVKVTTPTHRKQQPEPRQGGAREIAPEGAPRPAGKRGGGQRDDKAGAKAPATGKGS